MAATIAPVTVHTQSVADRLADLGSIGHLPADASSAIQDTQPTPEAPSFERVLMGVVDSANRSDATASRMADDLSRGASDDLHGTMIAAKEAGISIHLVGSIRNKLLDAFHELWRTSV